MANHTPAPWRYDVESAAVFYDDGDVRPNIAFIEDNASDTDRDLADGLLIAAAPDLLLALQMALPALEWCEKQWAGSPQHGDGLSVMDTVRAALAKAIG